ncbi:fumarase, class I alpha subunit [Sporobacter termitidis DSM 10068]|uniref:Fumarase, class I alpha subunit n=1 Tax=Sporobacter termitidis DSM 10068 TaxID=1123282 RepID=A0A1M5VBT0_9FIRM|nr:fumarate hydratase [Sporobacter termitidis]SHH72665.1 fumarase, class I alpha subunit [Sporobacter termitidis DSM 10068]
MREIDCSVIAEAVERLCIEAAVHLPKDLCALLEDAAGREESPAGAEALRDIVANFKLAAETGIPICQDTGMAVVFADIGQEVHITGGLLEDAVNEGVRRGYTNGYLRKSVVKDPLRRENTEDNTPAVLHLRLVAGDKISLTVAPKGFGSENMSAMRMFLPSDKLETIEDFIVDVMSGAGSNPCPPVVIGVGLGGTIEQAALLAKRALLRDMGSANGDKFYADMEARVLEKVNRLGIGPQGFGGRFTAVKVNIETYPTHIAGLPCVVNMSCHATRHAACVL